MNAPATTPAVRQRARCLTHRLIRGGTVATGVDGKWARSSHCSSCRTTKLDLLTRDELDEDDVRAALDAWLLERGGRRCLIERGSRIGTFSVVLLDGHDRYEGEHRDRTEATILALEKASG